MDISVIVPVFNVKEYVSDCLNSLIHQDFFDYEIIVVDDGSSDGSEFIVDNYAVTYPDKIKVFHQANSGPSDARNSGIKKSSGKYIAFVDGDDWVDDCFLSRMYKKIIEDDSDIVACDIYRSYPSGREMHGTAILPLTSDLRKNLLWGPAYAWNKLFRRELFDNDRFPEGILYEDLATIPILVLNAKKVSYIPVPMCHYRVRPQSIVTQYTERILDTTIALERVRKKVSSDFHLEIEFLCINSIVTRYSGGFDHKGAKNIQNSLRNYLYVQFPEWTKNIYLNDYKSLRFRVRLVILKYDLPIFGSLFSILLSLFRFFKRK